MMKNSEWGAAAYLSQSKYGKYGNSLYQGINKEVAKNDNSGYITGGGNYLTNIAQSTTGNITGIYDMNGGKLEYVMGSYFGYEGKSGWGNLPMGKKYYESYYGISLTKACGEGECYGHALSETAGWYDDFDHFVSNYYTWFNRGIDGIFSFDSHTGGSNPALTCRIVISPTT